MVIVVERFCWYVVLVVLYLVHNTKERFHNTSRVDSWDNIHGSHLLPRVQCLAGVKGTARPHATFNDGHQRLQPRGIFIPF